MLVLRRGGTIEAVGIGDQIVEVPWARMIKEVIKLHFCRGTTQASFAKFCELAAAGKLNLGPIASHRFPLEDWKKGFESAESRDAVKTLLMP